MPKERLTGTRTKEEIELMKEYLAFLGLLPHNEHDERVLERVFDKATKGRGKTHPQV